MAKTDDEILCESLLELKTLIQECKDIILGGLDQIDEKNIDGTFDDLIEANEIYKELILQLLQ